MEDAKPGKTINLDVSVREQDAIDHHPGFPRLGRLLCRGLPAVVPSRPRAGTRDPRRPGHQHRSHRRRRRAGRDGRQPARRRGFRSARVAVRRRLGGVTPLARQAGHPRSGAATAQRDHPPHGGQGRERSDPGRQRRRRRGRGLPGPDAGAADHRASAGAGLGLGRPALPDPHQGRPRRRPHDAWPNSWPTSRPACPPWR